VAFRLTARVIAIGNDREKPDKLRVELDLMGEEAARLCQHGGGCRCPTRIAIYVDPASVGEYLPGTLIHVHESRAHLKA
jgi:hypothetical protein